MSWLLKPSLEGSAGTVPGEEKEKLTSAAEGEKPKSRLNLSLGWIWLISLILLCFAFLLVRKEPTIDTPAPLSPPPPPLPPLSLDELRGLVDGDLLLPGQPQYEKRRQVWLTVHPNTCENYTNYQQFIVWPHLS